MSKKHSQCPGDIYEEKAQHQNWYDEVWRAGFASKPWSSLLELQEVYLQLNQLIPPQERTLDCCSIFWWMYFMRWLTCSTLRYWWFFPSLLSLRTATKLDTNIYLNLKNWIIISFLVFKVFRNLRCISWDGIQPPYINNLVTAFHLHLLDLWAHLKRSLWGFPLW